MPRAVAELREKLHRGMVIPAHPLALTAGRKLDERRQRALTRYYLDAGAGGIAIGVHTTQFAIRDPKAGLLRPVLELVREESRAVNIAGVCGQRAQAMQEAELAASLDYDAVLLSLGALRDAPVIELLEHARAVASVVPVFGFYLQPAVGGRVLPYEFWRRFVEIDNIVAVKIAPFNRYQTLEVLRAVAESGRTHEVALYTGNDDNILLDLLTTFDFGGRHVHIAGGLLGHWAVWTRTAVGQFRRRSTDSEVLRARSRRRAGACAANHRFERRDLRSRQRVSRLHPRYPRDPAPPGIAGRPLVP